MSIPKLNSDLRIIQKLSDLPNTGDGLTAQELKEKFDQGALTIQNWVNAELIPTLVAKEIPFAPSGEIAGENVQSAIEHVQAQIRDAFSGKIVNGSVTKEKLSADLLERVYGGRCWVALDEPGEQDNISGDFPVGQLWLCPGFTVENKAVSWMCKNGSVTEQDNLLTVTGDATAETVTLSQTVAGLGQSGDRVYVLFSVEDADEELEAMKLKLGAEGHDAMEGGVFTAILGSGGSLSAELTATWPAKSLADGSFGLRNFSVVNVDAVLRQNPHAHDKADWGGYLESLLPLAVHACPQTLWVHSTDGHWRMASRDLLPGALLVGGGDSKMENLSVGEDGSYLTVKGGKPVWADRESTVQELGAVRLATGTYVGTGAERTLTLPLAPKLLVLSSDEGPLKDRNNTVLWDNPVILRDGATSGAWGSGRDSENTLWRDTVSLRGAELAFSKELGNRQDVTYTWVAIY